MLLQHLGRAGTLRLGCSASSKSSFVNSTVATPIYVVNALRYQWTTSEDGSLVANYITISPAHQVVLGLRSCKCAQACRPNDCTCIIDGLKCTAACKWQTCHNTAGDDDEPENDQQDSSDSEDE